MTVTDIRPIESTDVPDLTQYVHVHQAMRRANDQLVDALRDIEAGDRVRARALHWWFEGYGGELRTHHRVEDELVFPALHARVAEYAPYSEDLAEDHHILDHLIDLISGSLAHLASGSREWKPAHVVALAAATELRGLLLEHLGVEDEDVLPMIRRNFSASEFAAIEQQVLKMMSLRQASFTVPWFMATVDPVVAEHARAEAPALLQLIYRVTRRRYARRAAIAFATR